MKWFYLLLFLASVSGTSWYLYRTFSVSEELSLENIPTLPHSDLCIGIIGDSWVSHCKLDATIKTRLLENGIKAKVISAGQPGAKTKTIYQNLFKKGYFEFSGKFILDRRPKYCIVVCGVNDAMNQTGKKYYSYHLILIIKALLKRKIKPIVVSLPTFGINEQTNQLGFFKWSRNKIFAWFNNEGKIDNIKDYREYFVSEFTKSGLKDSVIYFNFDEVCANYSTHLDLYANPTHLSDKGNRVFGEKLADLISRLDRF